DAQIPSRAAVKESSLSFLGSFVGFSWNVPVRRSPARQPASRARGTDRRSGASGGTSQDGTGASDLAGGGARGERGGLGWAQVGWNASSHHRPVSGIAPPSPKLAVGDPPSPNRATNASWSASSYTPVIQGRSERPAAARGHTRARPTSRRAGVTARRTDQP